MEEEESPLYCPLDLPSETVDFVREESAFLTNEKSFSFELTRSFYNKFIKGRVFLKRLLRFAYLPPLSQPEFFRVVQFREGALKSGCNFIDFFRF